MDRRTDRLRWLRCATAVAAVARKNGTITEKNNNKQATSMQSQCYHDESIFQRNQRQMTHLHPQPSPHKKYGFSSTDITSADK